MYKQGDIVMVYFPYNDTPATSKQRPVVILSNTAQSSHHFIMAKITSVIRNDAVSFAIFKQDIDFELHHASEVRTNGLATISPKLFKKRLGSFSFGRLQKLLTVVQDNFV